MMVMMMVVMVLVRLTIAVGARQQPQHRMIVAAANVRQQLQLATHRTRRLPVSRWRTIRRRAALVDDHLDGRFIEQNRVHLIDHDGDDEQAKQRRFEQQQNAVQPAIGMGFSAM